MVEARGSTAEQGSVEQTVMRRQHGSGSWKVGGQLQLTHQVCR
jgi:hypothetical protein